MSLLDFIPGVSAVKLLGVAAVAIAISGGFYYVHHLSTEITHLEDKNNILIVNNKVLQENNEVIKNNAISFSKANETNLETINSLLAERQAAEKAIADLAAVSTSNKKVIANLNNKINDMLKDPKNDGIVSPVLRETIRGVQNNRR